MDIEPKIKKIYEKLDEYNEKKQYNHIKVDLTEYESNFKENIKSDNVSKNLESFNNLEENNCSEENNFSEESNNNIYNDEIEKIKEYMFGLPSYSNNYDIFNDNINDIFKKLTDNIRK